MFFVGHYLEPCGGQNKLFRKLPEMLIDDSLSRITRYAEQASEHTNDVAVQNGPGLVEGNAADGAGGITADPREGEHVVKVFREFSVVEREDCFRGLLHVANTRVVTQAFPELVNSLRRGFGEGFGVRQGSHPALPKGEDCFDLGLLEHDFGNPDGVRIMRAAPGQVAGILGEPVEQNGDDCGEGSRSFQDGGGRQPWTR